MPPRSKQEREEEERGERRILAYHQALGRFVHEFAGIEAMLQFVLRHYTKVSEDARRAVFSGVRINEAISFLRRLAAVKEIGDSDWATLKPLLDQLSIINDRRNALLHHGAKGIAEGRPVTSNDIVALTPGRVRAFPMSARSLKGMSDDLRQIWFGLSYYHVGPRWLPRGDSKEWVEKELAAPWRYIPPRPKQNRPRRTAKTAERPRRPRASQA